MFPIIRQDSMELPYNKFAPSGMPEMAWGDFSNPRWSSLG